jgi:hypothetical protein
MDPMLESAPCAFPSPGTSDTAFKAWSASQFDTLDLGEASWFQGVGECECVEASLGDRRRGEVPIVGTRGETPRGEIPLGEMPRGKPFGRPQPMTEPVMEPVPPKRSYRRETDVTAHIYVLLGTWTTMYIHTLTSFHYDHASRYEIF